MYSLLTASFCPPFLYFHLVLSYLDLQYVIYFFCQDLTRPLQLGKRDTYIEVTSSVWPYFLEILEANGIVERHPTDKKRIRIIDFSDGQFGS